MNKNSGILVTRFIERWHEKENLFSMLWFRDSSMANFWLHDHYLRQTSRVSNDFDCTFAGLMARYFCCFFFYVSKIKPHTLSYFQRIHLFNHIIYGLCRFLLATQIDCFASYLAEWQTNLPYFRHLKNEIKHE